MFNRTQSGLIAKYLFYNVPILWVEGETDIPFYYGMVLRCFCRIESAGGKTECQRLADALINDDLPYVVVMDGDYDLLLRGRNRHKRVIMLRRYAMENYLFESEVIEAVCQKYAKVCSSENVLGVVYNSINKLIEAGLKELIVLDIAHYLANSDKSVMPSSAEALLSSKTGLSLAEHRIENIMNDPANNVPQKYIDDAKRLINKYLVGKRIAFILRGHVIFGIMRRMILECVEAKSGRKPIVDKIGLLNLLCDQLHIVHKSSDYSKLKNSVKRAIRDASNRRRFK